MLTSAWIGIFNGRLICGLRPDCRQAASRPYDQGFRRSLHCPFGMQRPLGTGLGIRSAAPTRRGVVLRKDTKLAWLTGTFGMMARNTTIRDFNYVSRTYLAQELEDRNRGHFRSTRTLPAGRPGWKRRTGRGRAVVAWRVSAHAMIVIISADQRRGCESRSLWFLCAFGHSSSETYKYVQKPPSAKHQHTSRHRRGSSSFGC